MRKFSLIEAMWFIKRYWDIIGGFVAGFALATIAKFNLEGVQLCYSVIILILVCIGILRFFRQHTERKHTIIDSFVDGQKTIKAISLAQSPTQEGEKVGEIILTVIGGEKKIMEKLKEFFSKFKGYMLTIALAVLAAVEMCGGFINGVCGGVLTVKGVEIVPIVTLVCAVIVGILSNGYTKEQRESIKALLNNSGAVTNELVLAEIKKTIKEQTATLAQLNKDLSTLKGEYAKLEVELASLENTLSAKNEMYAMTPRLATEADVQSARNAIVDCQAKLADKKAEIAKATESIKNITATISALKSQL